MRRCAWIAGWTLLAAGCVSPTPERVRDYTQDGMNLYRKGDYVSARESFQAALAIQPEDTGLLYNVGQCYDRVGDVGKAERFYNECLQREPDNVTCHHALAMLLVRTGRGSDAVRSVDAWLTRSPNLAAAHAEDAWLWHQAGDLPRTQSRLQEALLLDPRDWRALSELASVYEEQQRPDRALALYEQSLEENPNQPDISRRLAELRQKGVQRPKPE